MGRLDGKIALITGGARGQGAEEARLFASEGATVVLTDVLDEVGVETAASIGAAASYAHLDVTSEGDWQTVVAATLEDHGRIDVLVNNAGIVYYVPLEEMSLESYMRVVAVNQTGVFLGMRTVAAAMRSAGRGSIINISSVSGLQGRPGQVAYAASKWAVRGMSRVVAREFAPHGVRVNTIHPGAVETPMLEDAGVDEARRREIVGNIPLGDFASPAAIANVALFLASDESAYCTGAEFVVDGGLTA